MEKEELLLNIDKIHTTKMGIERIKRNLGVTNPLSYCKKMIMNKESIVSRKGKNYYCIIDNIIITVNASSYTIITAHKDN